jgi:cytoplasmic iron level regulating protein YaaA (DUF328/UPF0246 family)
MITVLSPSKTLDFETPSPVRRPSQPRFAAECMELVSLLRSFDEGHLASLMKLSPKLAALNYARYQSFEDSFNKSNSKPAIDAFRGDVYKAFQDQRLSEAGYEFAQRHIRILSGLYGVLRPWDLIQPYRLEMGTVLENPRGENLYKFWRTTVTKSLASELKKSPVPVLLNLASKEYFGVVDLDALVYPCVHVHFKERSGDKLRVIALKAKRARGVMAQWLAANKVDSLASLKTFSDSGYKFSELLSSDSDYVYVR